MKGSNGRGAVDRPNARRGERERERPFTESCALLSTSRNPQETMNKPKQ